MPGSVSQTTSAYAATSPLTTAAFGSTPPAGDIVVSLVAAITVMSASPTGATQRGKLEANQGAYWWDKTAGASEPNTVTVTPNGAFTTALASLDLNGVTGFDTISAVASNQGTAGQTSCAINPITTAAGNGDLVIAAALITGTGPINTPVWGNGFTALPAVGGTVIGSGSAAVFAAWKLVPASTAVGATTVSWTGGASNTVGWMAGYTTQAAGPSLTLPVGLAGIRWAGLAPTLSIGITLQGQGPPTVRWAGLPVALSTPVAGRNLIAFAGPATPRTFPGPAITTTG